MVYPVSRLAERRSPDVDPGAAIQDPLQHLVACHDRIEQRLQILERVIPHLRSDSEEKRREARQALDNALHFLEVMGSLHTQDEEESVFPRVLASAGDDAPMLRELTTMLETQHREKEAVFEQLKSHVAGFPASPSPPSPEQASRFEGLVAQLAGLYRPHIMIENERLIPLSAAHLNPADSDEIRQEMRARRGADEPRGVRP